jgi:hypothetical protein
LAAKAGRRWAFRSSAAISLRGDRRATLEALLGSLLPRALAGRDTKALFDEVFWAGGAGRLAGTWDGAAGIDAPLVDAQTLREIWSQPRPDPRTALLLQQVALDQRAR